MFRPDRPLLLPPPLIARVLLLGLGLIQALVGIASAWLSLMLGLLLAFEYQGHGALAGLAGGLGGGPLFLAALVLAFALGRAIEALGRAADRVLGSGLLAGLAIRRSGKLFERAEAGLTERLPAGERLVAALEVDHPALVPSGSAVARALAAAALLALVWGCLAWSVHQGEPYALASAPGILLAVTPASAYLILGLAAPRTGPLLIGLAILGLPIGWLAHGRPGGAWPLPFQVAGIVAGLFALVLVFLVLWLRTVRLLLVTSEGLRLAELGSGGAIETLGAPFRPDVLIAAPHGAGSRWTFLAATGAAATSVIAPAESPDRLVEAAADAGLALQVHPAAVHEPATAGDPRAWLPMVLAGLVLVVAGGPVRTAALALAFHPFRSEAPLPRYPSNLSDRIARLEPSLARTLILYSRRLASLGPEGVEDLEAPLATWIERGGEGAWRHSPWGAEAVRAHQEITRRKRILALPPRGWEPGGEGSVRFRTALGTWLGIFPPDPSLRPVFGELSEVHLRSHLRTTLNELMEHEPTAVAPRFVAAWLVFTELADRVETLEGATRAEFEVSRERRARILAPLAKDPVWAEAAELLTRLAPASWQEAARARIVARAVQGPADLDPMPDPAWLDELRFANPPRRGGRDTAPTSSLIAFLEAPPGTGAGLLAESKDLGVVAPAMDQGKPVTFTALAALPYRELVQVLRRLGLRVRPGLAPPRAGQAFVRVLEKKP